MLGAAAPTASTSLPAAPKKSSTTQLMPDMLNVTKKPSKRSAANNPGKASPSKRRKEAPVHPRLPMRQNAELDDVHEMKMEGAVSQVQRLGLPVDRLAIEKALSQSDVAFDRYVGLLQAQRAAAMVAAQRKQAQAVQLPPSPTSLASSAMPPTPTSLPDALPTLNLVLTIDSSGRAAIKTANSPTTPPAELNPVAPLPRRSRGQVVAAEIEGMGRVVLERSVLVDRLGPNGAAVAEAKAHGSIAPPMMSQTLAPPPPLFPSENLPFGFGAKSSGPRLPLASIANERDIVADRQQRIAAWLSTPDDDGLDAEEDVAPRRPSDAMDEDVPLHAYGMGKSVARLAKQASHRFEPTVVEMPESPVKVAPSPWSEPPPVNQVFQDGVVDCLCHRGDDKEGEDLVQCERCRSWYHLGCVDLDVGSLPEHWLCVRCTGGEMPMAWRTRQQSIHGTPLRREAPVFVNSALTPRVGHFTNSFLSSELALAPSPAVGRADHKRVRISAEYSPRSPSRSMVSYGQRKRLQSGQFEDVLPAFDDEHPHHQAMPSWPASASHYEIEPPLPAGPGHLIPSTPSRYAYTSSDGLSHQVTPASTIDGTHSRSSSATGTSRFSFPSTPSSQELMAHFDSASSMQTYHHLASFSPVCEQSPLIMRHRRNRSSMSGPSAAALKANWATGPPASSAGLIKAMMQGQPGESSGMARTGSGLGIGFEAGGELVQPNF